MALGFGITFQAKKMVLPRLESGILKNVYTYVYISNKYAQDLCGILNKECNICQDAGKKSAGFEISS